MTGGFSTNIRGIEIDIVRTLNKFLNQNKTSYTRTEFENYLNKIGLIDSFGNSVKVKKPYNDGFVVSLEYDGFDVNKAVGYLATDLWEYQDWVSQDWSVEELQEQIEFKNPKYLDSDIEKNLRNRWRDKLILTGKFTVHTVDCEWSHSFFPKNEFKNQNQRGGKSNSYHNKYLKYKKKYLDLKSKIQ
ncbi:hypothetical protein QLL95_gp0464 [Cotonvirus japonicus]|uniref:Uncharacterized protein n=1 Tax=Cotonvirus japonicus TaxID=2811091 RepID=A0ABM7NU48_9VIRU|nr:hypothetical protein QLL95_gp0464 [Cotonvirus japonicus]BCS83659.1 hypothetical protein [Cotonvirus japonicus]